jgi:hypothetical protein
MLVRMWRNRNPYTVLVGVEISTTSMECSVEIPQKPEDRTAYHPVILILGIQVKER